MATSRPHPRTVSELRVLIDEGHENLVALGDGNVAWIGSAAKLGAALGIKRQAMTGRLRTLTKAKIADTTLPGRIVFDMDRLSELVTGVRHLRVAGSTEQFRSAVSAEFQEQRTADGGVAYHHRQTGQRATVRDLTDAVGYESPGTTQYHLQSINDSTSGQEPQESSAGTVSPAEQPRSNEVLVSTLDGLRGLLNASQGDHTLTCSVMETIAQVSRTGTQLFTDGSPPVVDDAKLVSDDAFSSRGSRLNHDYELSKSSSVSNNSEPSTRLAAKRVVPREENASLSRRPGLPADKRDLTKSSPARTDQELVEIMSPLVKTVSKSHPQLKLNWTSLATAVAPWPNASLADAVQVLTEQVEIGAVTGAQRIDNPYGVLITAAKRGDLEYFPYENEDGISQQDDAATPVDDTAVRLRREEPMLRSCFVADIERIGLEGALQPLVDRCDNKTFEPLARQIVETHAGPNGLKQFEHLLSNTKQRQVRSDYQTSLTRAQRKAILAEGQTDLL